MNQAVEKGFSRGSYQEELLPHQVKEVESLKPSQCKVLPQGEEDKAVQWYLVLVEACQKDEKKSQSALIVIDDIWVFADY